MLHVLQYVTSSMIMIWSEKVQITNLNFPFMYCLKHEQQCFIGFKNTRRSRVFLNPIKHVLRVF